MEAWQKRVLEEEEQLLDRIGKLRLWLQQNPVQKDMLMQLQAMELYAYFLNKRINSWTTVSG